MRALLVLAVAAALEGCAGAPPIPGAATGTVTGIVILAPCAPVERANATPCPPRPGVKVHFDRGEVTVATAVTDGAGVYRVTLPVATYGAWAEGGITRVPPRTEVIVQAGQTVTLNLAVDSGIR